MRAEGTQSAHEAWVPPPWSKFAPIYVPLSLATVGAVVLTWDGRDWRPTSLVVSLAALSVLGFFRLTTLGTIHLNATTPTLALASCLLGPAPAAVIAVASIGPRMVVDHRPGVHKLLNLTTLGLSALIGGLAFNELSGLGWTDHASAALPIAVTAIALLNSWLTYLLLVPCLMMEGVSPTRSFRESFVPAQPWEACGAVLAGFSAYTYYSLGFEAIVGLGLFVLLLLWLLVPLERAERGAKEIARAQAERLRFAAEVHDDALQLLASARQDLIECIEGDPDRARRALSAVGGASASLRGLLQDSTPHGGVTVGDAVARAQARAEAEGLTFQSRISPGAESVADPLVVAAIQEGTINVARHASARNVWAEVHVNGTELTVEIADDGIGGDISLDDARRSGHFGLSLLSRRASARGGALILEPRGPTGVRLRLSVPLAAA